MQGLVLYELFRPFTTAMERANIWNNLREAKLEADFIAVWPEVASV